VSKINSEITIKLDDVQKQSYSMGVKS
jgi:hypothetical protein